MYDPIPQTIPQLRDRHRDEVRSLILSALHLHDWRLRRTAEYLDVAVGSLQAMIEAHGLGVDYATHSHGPGRPHSM